MTREERDNALKVLENYDLNFHRINGMLFSAEEIANAFDMAIKALEQELCEDAISRQAVLDDLEKSHMISKVHNQGTWNECVDSMIRTVRSMPSVTPARKKGKWKWEEDWTPSTPVSPEECNYAGWVCSECGKFPDEYVDWDNPDEKPTYDYCPNCGAKMEVEE